MVSNKCMTDESCFYELKISELTLPLRMAFLRKYMAATLLQFTLFSLVSTLIILSPMARFYITENVWLLFLLLFLFCSTYLSLVHFSKLSVTKFTLVIHVVIEAFTIGVMVTYNDMMYLYQAVLLITICFLCLFLYTLQSKLNFGFCIIILVYFVCSLGFSTILRNMFGGTPEEEILWMACASFVLCYHGFYIVFFSGRLSADDLLCVLVNAYTLPINACVYSTPIHKPSK